MLGVLDRSITVARASAHSIGAVIPNGSFEYAGQDALFVRIRSANHHQVTYEIAAAALSALRGYMLSHQFGAASFWIYDGNREVGTGLVGVL